MEKLCVSRNRMLMVGLPFNYPLPFDKKRGSPQSKFFLEACLMLFCCFFGGQVLSCSFPVLRTPAHGLKPLSVYLDSSLTQGDVPWDRLKRGLEPSSFRGLLGTPWCHIESAGFFSHIVTSMQLSPNDNRAGHQSWDVERCM